MKRSHPIRLLPALLAALLCACGGGKAPEPQAEQALISGRAVDGPLAGATACYDLNDNGGCDAGEPTSAATTADGSFSIAIAPAQAGRHAVVVDVPASAVDADTGRMVGSAFTLRAPATGTSGSHAVFVSPLTTLVQAHMLYAGVTLAEASALVQAQAGIDLSPLADFTRDGSAAARKAARVARLVQLTANEQQTQLSGVVGTAARDGNAITAADVDREVQASLLGGLPLVAGTLADPGLSAATGTALQALLGVAARSIALQLDVTADALRTASSMQRLAEPAPANPPVATGTLRFLRYTDGNNWLMRMHQASAADNVVDANGYVRFYDWFTASASNATTGTALTTAGVVAPGTTASTHWNGTAWVTRAAQQRWLTRLRDAQGRSDYNFSDGLEVGIGVRRVEDISGQTLQDVVRSKIRRFPGSTGGVAFANWGPSNLGLYGTATFPAGSYLIYQSNTTTSTAVSYNPSSSGRVLVYNAAVSAGGDVRVNAGLACNDPQQNGVTAAAPTLEAVVAAFRGTPCLFNQGGVTPNFSLTPDAWWGAASVNLGDLPNTNTLPAGTGNYYNTTANLRVSFAATGNRATFWRCYRRATDSSPRNCSILGLGTWTIQTVGNGRTLGFSVAPALAQRLGTERYFVERGGQVYFGNKSPVGATTTDLRLNLTAANAVFHQLGLPRAKPVTEPGTATGARAASLSTLQGTWGGATLTEANVWRFGPNGRFFMAEAKPYLPLTQEQSGAELGWIDHDPAGQYFSTLLEVDSNLTSGTSHPQPGEMFQPFTITPTAISSGAGANSFTLPRLETATGATAATSLVGMWAFGSSTDLSVPHVVFFSNGRFMLITHSADPQCVGTDQCPPGVEFSAYTYVQATGTLTVFNMLYDTNGCDGAFATCAAGSNNTSDQSNVVIAAGGLTAVLTDSLGLQFTLFRVPAQ